MVVLWYRKVGSIGFGSVVTCDGMAAVDVMRCVRDKHVKYW